MEIGRSVRSIRPFGHKRRAYARSCAADGLLVFSRFLFSDGRCIIVSGPLSVLARILTVRCARRMFIQSRLFERLCDVVACAQETVQGVARWTSEVQDEEGAGTLLVGEEGDGCREEFESESCGLGCG